MDFEKDLIVAFDLDDDVEDYERMKSLAFSYCDEDHDE